MTSYRGFSLDCSHDMNLPPLEILRFSNVIVVGFNTEIRSSPCTSTFLRTLLLKFELSSITIVFPYGTMIVSVVSAGTPEYIGYQVVDYSHFY